MSRGGQFLLGLAFSVLGLGALVLTYLFNSIGWWVHGAWCFVGLALITPVVYRALTDGFLSLLQNHFLVFVGAFAVYNLFGALLPVIGPDDAIQFSLSYYPITPFDALRVDAANGIGFGLALIVGSVSYGRTVAAVTGSLARATSTVRTSHVIGLFLMVGIPASTYVVVADLGVQSGSISGIWRSLAQLSLVGAFIAIAHRGRSGSKILALGVGLMIVESLIGFLLLSKMAVFLPLIVILAGLSARSRNRLILPVGVVLVAVSFGSLGGVVAFGRNSLANGFDTDSSIETRVALVDQALHLTTRGDYRLSYHPWSRFYYTSAQTAAMDFYEQGQGGSSFRLIPWLFVPRALSASKPVITEGAADFHTKITGHEGTSTGQGIFLSGFYSGGWVGLLIVSAACGWILAQTSAIAGVVVRRRDALLIPLALLGVDMAFKISGHYLWNYFGPFVLLLYLLGGGALVASSLRRRNLSP